MPNGEDQFAIAFHEYPGGPPIIVHESRIDDWDVDEDPSSFLIGRAKANHLMMVPLDFMGAETSRVISRELAVAATRQIYFSNQYAIAIRHYSIPRRKALIGNREYEGLVPRLPARRAIEPSSRETEELRRLEDKVKFLEAQLESYVPYLQLYRFGAAGLFIAIISVVIWLLTGTGFPFHPVFAAGVIPAALGVIAMAFLVRQPNPPK